MDKQQEQMNQKQQVQYTSGFLNEDEEVNESDFDEPIEEQKKAAESSGNQQNKSKGEEQPKKLKRTRKTIEQEIAELDAKRERLMEKKRKQEAHEKIVFGATVIAMLKEMKNCSYQDYTNIYNKIMEFTKKNNMKNIEIISNIFSNIIK